MATITIELKSETERRLRSKAVAQGLTLESYVGRMVETDADSSLEAKEARLDLLLAPARNAFLESGMTDDDIKALVDEARAEIRREKQARKSS